jgi:glycosyltransferase 2 family protein
VARLPPEPVSRLRRPRDWLIGLTLLAGLLIAVDHRVGWPALFAPWRDIPAPLLVGAFVLTAASYGLRAVRVYDYFGPLVAGRFLAVLRLSVLHNAANNLLPMRIGEVVFPWLMRRYFGHGFLAAGASLLWIRVMDLHCLVLAGLAVGWLWSPAWWWPLLGVLWLALVPAGLAVRRLGWVERLPAGRPRRVLLFVLDAAPADAALLLRLYLETLAIWATKLTAFVLVLSHFVAAAYWQLLAGVLGAELSSVLPFHGIAGAGSYELSGMAALVPLGVSVETALAGAVSLHLFLLGTTLLLGALAFLLPAGGASGSGDCAARASGQP